MDLTSNFMSLVKTLRSRSKALGDVDERKNPRTHREEGHFNSTAKEVVSSITQMKEFFIEHRKDYIDQRYLIYNVSRMSDTEREEIDSEAHKFIAKCKQVIGNLRKEVSICAKNGQEKEHFAIVVHIIEEYLRVVSRIWSNQKAVRVRRANRLKLIGSLTGGQKMKKARGGFVEFSTKSEPEFDEGFEEGRDKRLSPEDEAPKRRRTFSDDDYLSQEFRSVEITQADLLALEEENTRLYDELNSMAEQVTKIEGKVVELSELQKQFSDKVIEQDEDVQRIANTMMHATENVRDANEQLRQAMQNNAGLRVAILFVLIVLSFSLLFLDWYNP